MTVAVLEVPHTDRTDTGGRPQVDELLSAARVPVFLLDENQVVRPGEMGTVRDITAAAAGRGIAVTHVDLDAQFRCGGSLEFIDWVERLLELRPAGPLPWEDNEAGYTVEVMDAPHELEGWLHSLQAEGYGARITAGYCWRWSDPRPDGSLVDDVRIGEWSRPWNLKGDRASGGAPPAALWASDPAGFGQVGCIYTAQGFEYDFASVIIGPGLVRRGGRWVADPTGSKDPVLTRRTQVLDADVERLIRNVYKVLLTRGMRGVGIYSTDRQTREFIAELL